MQNKQVQFRLDPLLNGLNNVTYISHPRTIQLLLFCLDMLVLD
ncbi:hypothetical protein MtrunA17_Chr1g0206591 [Medicago truncatula]|uniref:Uncharacterized protein n=1 Tax=Medicago truncatula TaxID=3880 RepID=A0A396K2Q9_MEDTR|nr:hypothetical protein MtrunA17_Chr1g0206591 [Medicago truncatula]